MCVCMTSGPVICSADMLHTINWNYSCECSLILFVLYFSAQIWHIYDCFSHSVTRMSCCFYSISVFFTLKVFRAFEMSPGSTVSLRVKCSPKSVEAVLALIFYNPPFLYIPLHCTNFFKPPNVLEWLVDVLIKRLESAFQCRLQAESCLFAFYPRSLLKTGRASSQPVCSFNSSSVVSRCECKSRLHSNTVGLRSQLCLNLCFFFFPCFCWEVIRCCGDGSHTGQIIPEEFF